VKKWQNSSYARTPKRTGIFLVLVGVFPPGLFLSLWPVDVPSPRFLQWPGAESCAQTLEGSKQTLDSTGGPSHTHDSQPLAVLRPIYRKTLGRTILVGNKVVRGWASISVS
jgi:hypothetical protein